METLASVWACDPHDLGELGQKQSSAWGSQCVSAGSPPAGLMWTEQLSPHLQRNKQLQDALLQREEQLARLQEENHKLREFLNSSFVRNLEEKAKKLPADGRRRLRRNLMDFDDRPFQNCGQRQVTCQPVSKRVCRNLTAEFCSETSETSSSSSEPNLDLWVLRTLGLKDRDTIDSSSDSSSPQCSLGASVYGVAITSSNESTLESFSPSAAPPMPTSVHSCCQTHYSSAQSREGDWSQTAQNCRASPGQHFDLTTTGLLEAPGALTRSCNPSTALQTPPQTEPLNVSQSPGGAGIRSTAGSDQVQPLHWSPISQAASQDKILLSPPGDRLLFSPILSSSPAMGQLTPACSPSVGSRPPAAPQTPGSRTELAFRMSLSPSSSVKTHSFPQGQAFVRKDPEGKWNFTWLPRQGP